MMMMMMNIDDDDDDDDEQIIYLIYQCNFFLQFISTIYVAIFKEFKCEIEFKVRDDDR